MGLLAKQSKEQIKSTAISQQSSEIARSEWLLKRLGKTLQSYPMANLDKSGMDRLHRRMEFDFDRGGRRAI